MCTNSRTHARTRTHGRLQRDRQGKKTRSEACTAADFEDTMPRAMEYLQPQAFEKVGIAQSLQKDAQCCCPLDYACESQVDF